MFARPSWVDLQVSLFQLCCGAFLRLRVPGSLSGWEH